MYAAKVDRCQEAICVACRDVPQGAQKISYFLYESPYSSPEPASTCHLPALFPAIASIAHPQALVASRRNVLCNVESRRLIYINANSLVEPTSFVCENSDRVAR